MPLDLKNLIRDRRFQVAAAGVAAVGGYVLFQRKKTTGSTSAQPANANTTGTGSVGTFDSTGTDVAGWLGSQSGQFQGILDDFTKQLNGTLTSINAGGPQPTPNPSPTPVPRRDPGPVLVPTSGGGTPNYVTVRKYTGSNPAWNSTLSGIAGHEHTTVPALLRLNPQIHNANLIITGSQIRVS